MRAFGAISAMTFLSFLQSRRPKIRNNEVGIGMFFEPGRWVILFWDRKFLRYGHWTVYLIRYLGVWLVQSDNLILLRSLEQPATV